MKLEGAADKAQRRLDAIETEIVTNDDVRLVMSDFGIDLEELRRLAGTMAVAATDQLGNRELAREAGERGLTGYGYLQAVFAGNWLHGLLTGLLAMREAK